MKTKIFFISIFNLLICNLVIAQSITNTLGTSGVFTLKDNATTYLSLSQSTGNLSLNRGLVLSNTTSSTVGVVYKGADRFIHNYGTENTFLGINSGNFTMDGVINTAIGVFSLSENTIGSRNSAFGVFSLAHNTTGEDNSAFGTYSLFNNISGTNNSAFGISSLTFNSTGFQNSALGSYSLYSNQIGWNNTAVGMNSLYSNNAHSNTAVGSNSMYTNNTGTENTAVGRTSLYSNTTGIENTAVGNNSLYSNTINSGNTAVGYNALFASTGWQNTAVGHHSLQLNTTGSYNTASGYNAGSIVTTGYNLTLIGIDANPTTGTAIDQVTLGNGFVTSLRCNVQTITSLSDARDKKNIKELSLGLYFITKLKPRQFNWDKREWYETNTSDGSKMDTNMTAGFIAQEFDEVQNSENAEWLKLVLKDNPEKWEATPGNLLPIVVKAIQELKAENDKLKSELDELKSVNEKVAKLESIIQQLQKKDGSLNEIKTVEK